MIWLQKESYDPVGVGVRPFYLTPGNAVHVKIGLGGPGSRSANLTPEDARKLAIFLLVQAARAERAKP